MYRELTYEDKHLYDRLANHPLQSWEWGEFRKQLGTSLIRIGELEGKMVKRTYQLTLHPIPFTPYTIGYFPKGPIPDTKMIEVLIQVGKKYNCIFIQLEPNVVKSSRFAVNSKKLFSSARPLFTKYTFHIDLTKSEDELLKSFHPKTRYNIRIAQKHGVTIQEENTNEAFEKYLELTQETTVRQNFYAHNDFYHRQMWKILRHASSKGGQAEQVLPIAHLLTARYKGEIITTWILFLFKGVLYYPYGASTTKFKEVMASNLMMWEAIRFGMSHGAKIFDLWGTPGKDPQPSDPYYGFHRFKLGYNPELIEFVGSYDLVLKPLEYRVFVVMDKIRWALLRFKSKLKSQPLRL